MMEAIDEYLRSHLGVIRASLVYIIRRTILVQTYGDNPMCVTSHNEMVARMLHIPPERKKVLLEYNVNSVKEYGSIFDTQQNCLQYLGPD